MGSPWGLTLTLFLLYYESKWLAKYYRRYLDVKFLMSKKKDHV